MRSEIYTTALSILLLLSSVVSCMLWLFSQNALAENMQTNPASVVAFGDLRFTFAILMFISATVLSYFYIITWREKPKSQGESWAHSKKELILLTILVIVTSVANLMTLNVSWEFAVIDLGVLIYEAITLKRYYYS